MRGMCGGERGGERGGGEVAHSFSSHNSDNRSSSCSSHNSEIGEINLARSRSDLEIGELGLRAHDLAAEVAIAEVAQIAVEIAIEAAGEMEAGAARAGAARAGAGAMAGRRQGPPATVRPTRKVLTLALTLA